MNHISSHRTLSSPLIKVTTRLRFPAVTGALLGTILTVAACSAAGPTHATAAPSTAHASVPAGSSSGAAGDSPGPAVSPAPAASGSAGQAGFASALAAWRSAAAAPAATINSYLQQAADDLQASGNSSYETAVNQLTYLADLPATNDTSAQQANAQSDVQALDNFFGTPGLMS